MPVEREFKYVLADFNMDLYSYLYKRCFDNWSSYTIEQGYIDDSSRIRSTKKLVLGNRSNYRTTPDSYEDDKFYYTFKKMVNGELIEIETIIGSDDYNKLKSIIPPDDILSKTRFEYKPIPEVTWCVDYFFGSDLYFVMAEFETIYDIKTAPDPYHLFKNKVIHVDDGTYNLTSRALCSRKYATSVMYAIDQGINNVH